MSKKRKRHDEDYMNFDNPRKKHNNNYFPGYFNTSPKKYYSLPSEKFGQKSEIIYRKSKVKKKSQSPKRSSCDDKDGHYIFKIREFIKDRYEVDQYIGDGTFSKVLKCMTIFHIFISLTLSNKQGWDAIRRHPVALKIIRSTPKYTKASEFEVDVLKKIKIQQEHDVCIHLLNNFVYKGHAVLVFPLYGMNIYDYIKKNRYRGFPLYQVKELTRQLLLGVKEIHKMGLIHTDLKPENILLKDASYYYKNEYKYLKRTDIILTDFGSAVYDHHTSMISTRHYRAPEVILNLKWNSKVDVWSLGCIFFELVCGSAMFQTHEDIEHLAIIEHYLGRIPNRLKRYIPENHYCKFFSSSQGRLRWPENSPHGKKSEKYVRGLKSLRDKLYDRTTHRESSLIIDLIRRMLAIDPKERISAREALRHPFFYSKYQR